MGGREGGGKATEGLGYLLVKGNIEEKGKIEGFGNMLFAV